MSPAVILGSRELPGSCDHPHASEAARRIRAGHGAPGEVSLPEVLAAISDAEARLTALRTSSSVPPEPDGAWVDDWLHRSYESFWAAL
jgi:hypothetical protein